MGMFLWKMRHYIEKIYIYLYKEIICIFQEY